MNISIIPKRLKRISLLVVLFSMISFSLSASQTISKRNKIEQFSELTITQEFSIKALFKYISEKTDYHFFYSNKLKEINKKVKINVANANIEKILQIAFKNLALEYKISGNEILIRKKTTVNLSPKQLSIITGNVKDDTNIPLPGVSILIQGTNSGTTTDFDGNFSIEASPEDYLVFSYMGYEMQTLKVGGKTSFEIIMISSSNMLDEVIIAGVAAGTSKKKMSISVTKIKADELTLVPQSSISSSLTGKIAGVNITSFNGSPGSGASINLRGATSLIGNQSPMILIDGVIMQGSLADINVDDVESIEVVKGAAASSLYGSKAGNGVIVITSKRGKKLSDGQTAITLRNQVEMQQVAKYLELSESHPYELSPNWQDVNTYTMYNNIDYPDDYISGWDPRINGNRIIKADGYMDLPYRVNNNLQESMFSDGLSYTNYVGIGHKVNDTNIFLSYENNADEGVVIETGGYKRQGFRANIDHAINDKLRLSASNNFIQTSNDFMGGGTGAFFDVLMMEPDADLFSDNSDGQQYMYFPSQWSTLVSNPLYDLWKKESNSEKTRFLGSYDIKWIITDWLDIKGSYAFETQSYRSSSYTPFGTFTGMQTDPNTNQAIKPLQSDGYLSRYTSKINNQNYRVTLNFTQSWNKLDFKGKLSYLYEDNDFENVSTNGANFTLPDLPSLNYFMGENVFSSDKQETIKAINYFAIASFVYNDRYIFDGLYRYDGSSLFGENERWHPYYRLSVAYRLSKDIKILGFQELKFRSAYGTSGQRPGFNYQYETFSVNNGIYSKETLGNKELKPSRSKEMEFGIDASFLNRFTFEATYSNTETSDQFLKAPLPAPFGGFKFQWVNSGTLETKTLEASLHSNILKKNNIKWNMGVNFDKTTSKITELDIPSYSTGPRSSFRIEEGGEYGVMYGVDFVRTLDQMAQQLSEGDVISNYSVNRDGVVVRTEDIGTILEKAFHLLDEDGNKKSIIIGNINPDFRMGVNTTFSYKNFSLYTLWKWKKGGDLYNATAQYLIRDLRHPMMDQIYTKPEDKKTVHYYKSLYDAQAVNGFWVEDASYVRLNEASIYYNLNTDSINKLKRVIKNIRIGVTGKNLITLTNYSGYDPEAGYWGFLFDNYGYPNFRNYALSVELKF